MDYAEALRACTENGADPDVLYGAANEIERLRKCAAEVIDSFEALGQAHGIAATLAARGRCERVMLALKDAMTPNEKVSGASDD